MKWLRAILVVALCSLGLRASAQSQQTGLCAPVKMVILQQLTLERVGFLATLEITDNDPNNPITGFSANLTFENPQLSTNGQNDSSSLFFVQPPTFQNISDASGTGVIGPGETATISWFIIPTVTAGGTNAFGIRYNVGASLSGMVNGVQIPGASLLVIPASITVAPDAQLDITYFQPRDVTGIDPFTGLGSPIPFTFGVLVQNVGYGPASDLKISSQQPKIVSNVQSLPLVAQLLGTRVNDSPLSAANLTVDLGTLQPGQASKGAWDMIVTFSGTFQSVSASYTHSSALGGQETSLIQSINAYLFLHEVLDDQPGRDSVRDFLADTSGKLDSVQNLIPDSLYESQGGVYPVNLASNVTASGSGLNWQVKLTPGVSGWNYIRLTDPNQARLPIVSVVRSDGKVLNTNNFWTSLHYEPVTNFKDTYLNLFDLVGLGNYTYAVTYTNPPATTNPPITTILFAGASTFTNGAYYITPETQVYFVSQSAIPAETLDRLGSNSYSLAIPFSLAAPGTYQLSYYSSNTSGISEAVHNVTLIVPGAASLGFAAIGAPSGPLYNPGSALSIRPTTVPISFQPQPYPTALNAQIDIFKGVVGWATVSNVPSSPTASKSAALTVGGQNVDFYMYQLNSNAWSAEASVATPLALSGLPTGTNTVSILGRSQYGTYLAATNALEVSWVVNASAPATVVSGAPATPTADTSAQLSIGGTSVTDYKWTIDGSYYRPATNEATPLILSNLLAGPHVVSTLGEVSGIFQATNNPTTVSWTVNPLYGYNMSSLTAVQSVDYTNIGGTVTYNWNGTGSNGVIEPAGWYTARITLSDANGDTNFAVFLVQIDALSGGSKVLANVTRGPQSPFARGRWAAWQDQSDGNWEIYVQDVTTNKPIVKVTSTALSQENPRTDGRYVVWQAQQTNGSWDIYIKDLESANGPQAVTSTPNIDEVYPSVDWPWVVYQARATGSTTAPWQVFAVNLATGLPAVAVSPTTQDELNPDVQAGRVVWQDLRNPGAGEIYFYDLYASKLLRITTNLYPKSHPAICDNWVVWQDSRNIEVDIYGYDFLRQREVQVTDTPEDETQPRINGPWVICMEDSLGPQTGNGRLIHLPSLVAVPITRTATLKSFPALADGVGVWQETVSNQAQIDAVSLPALEGVFQNRNAVPITPAMVAYAQDAFGLLADWGSNDVQSITEYTQLTPSVVSQTAYLTNGAAAGQNFTLSAGLFLWVKFNGKQVLDLGVNTNTPINLVTGANVLGYTGFPDSYHAFTFLEQIGTNNAQSVRMLDAESGRWRVAEVQAGSVVGDNFPIPSTAVLLVSVTNGVHQFTPQSP